MTQVYLYGIDLSNHQGKANMDLDKVLTKNPKCKVVIIKVSEGISFTDAYAKKFIEIALKHGCVVGVYHFGRPDKNGYLEEAKFFLSLSIKYRGKVFYVLDWEVKNGASNAKWAKGFLDYVAKQTGTIPVFYSYESMINSNNYSSFTQYPLWVAKYKDYVSDKNFDMSHAGTAPNVKWWSEYIAWQFTSVGRLDGYDGNLDCNAFYVDENYLKMLISPKASAPITIPAKDPVDVLLQIAQSEVGYHEGPNNSNKYGDEMHSIQPRNMDKNAPYCDAFCDWCVLQMCKKFGYGADMARKVLCGDFDDYTYFSVNLYKKAGRWTTKPGRGYQIFFGGDGHTGWVESVDSKIHTIEGNKGDEVRRCSYSLNDSRIIGYGMPRYDLIKGTATVEEPTTVNKNDGILRRGSTGKAVRFIQLCLGGLDDDGSFGWKTLSAVVEFQKSHGLEADGEVGPLTFAAILSTMPLIRKGDKGRYVKALQVALGGLEVDGSFGPLTDSAVREFQKEHSLVVDGEVGKKTWAAIFKYCFY